MALRGSAQARIENLTEEQVMLADSARVVCFACDASLKSRKLREQLPELTEPLDFDTSQLENLKRINKRTIEIARLHERIISENKFGEHLDNLIKMVEQQQMDISSYTRDDGYKRMLEQANIEYHALKEELISIKEAYLKIESIDISPQVIPATTKVSTPTPKPESSPEAEADVELEPRRTTLASKLSLRDVEEAKQFCKEAASKAKKYSYYAAGIIIGCSSIVLTALCPPAGVAVIGVYAGFTAGILDGVATGVTAGKDWSEKAQQEAWNKAMAESYSEFIEERKAIATKLEGEIEKVEPSILVKLSSALEQQLEDVARRRIGDVMQQAGSFVTSMQESTNSAAADSIQQRLTITKNLISLDTEVDSLSSNLIKFLREDDNPDLPIEKRVEMDMKRTAQVSQQFAELVKKVEEAKIQITSSDMPLEQKKSMCEHLSKNIENIRKMQSSFDKYRSADKQQIKTKCKSNLLRKIKDHKRSRMIGIAATVLAVASLTLVAVFPPAAPILVATVAVGVIALVMSSYDAAHSEVALKHDQSLLDKIEKENLDISNQQSKVKGDLDIAATSLEENSRKLSAELDAPSDNSSSTEAVIDIESRSLESASAALSAASDRSLLLREDGERIEDTIDHSRIEGAGASHHHGAAHKERFQESIRAQAVTPKPSPSADVKAKASTRRLK